MTSWPERVVILGATGFLGRALQACLSPVEVVSHSSRTLDMTRADALHGLDGVLDPGTALIFAAALTPDRGQTPATLLANVVMATNLAAYLDKRRPGHLTYIGSDAVYGFDADQVTESTPVAPASYYALAKYAGERVMDYAARAAGVPLLLLRITGLYGPGDPHGSYGPNAFARSLAHDRTLRIFGDGEEQRDHLYVDDAGRLVVALLRSRATGLYNVATGHSRSFAGILGAVQGIVPYEFRVTRAPRAGAITHRLYDIARLAQAVPGFAFTPFEAGLRATLADFGAMPRP